MVRGAAAEAWVTGICAAPARRGSALRAVTRQIELVSILEAVAAARSSDETILLYLVCLLLEHKLSIVLFNVVIQVAFQPANYQFRT